MIAVVALAEDPDVRLTTNITGSDIGDVHIGLEVRVRFEHLESVWLPFFEPSGATSTVETDVTPKLPPPRTPLGDERFEHRAVLSGWGGRQSAPGRRSTPSP